MYFREELCEGSRMLGLIHPSGPWTVPQIDQHQEGGSDSELGVLCAGGSPVVPAGSLRSSRTLMSEVGSEGLSTVQPQRVGSEAERLLGRRHAGSGQVGALTVTETDTGQARPSPAKHKPLYLVNPMGSGHSLLRGA